MRNVVFAINITVDGCCGHESVIADDELHEYFTGLLRDSDIEIFGRNTYHLMYPYWHDVAMNLIGIKSDQRVCPHVRFDTEDSLFNNIEERGVEQHNAFALKPSRRDRETETTARQKYFYRWVEHCITTRSVWSNR